MINVSVIIPNYNHAPFLKERIESVLSQTYQQFELIILDDASTDNSKAIIESYRSHPKVSHIEYAEQNSGSPFKQWSKGIALASYEWIWVAESDDYNSNDFLETGSLAIIRNTSIGLFYCDAQITETGSIGHTTFAIEKNAWFKTNKWSSDYIIEGAEEIINFLGIRCTVNNASSCLMKKELLQQQLKQIARFRYHGDWFSYIAVAANSTIAYSAKAMNLHRPHTGNIQSRLPEDGKDRVECFLIFCYLYQLPFYRQNKKLVREFILLNLNTGLFKGWRIWRSYFSINKSLAMKVFLTLLKSRISKH